MTGRECFQDDNAYGHYQRQLANELDRADAAVVVIAANDEASIDGVRTRWLPWIRSRNPQGNKAYLPVILAVNKADVIPSDSLTSLRTSLQQLVAECRSSRAVKLVNPLIRCPAPEIEERLECSVMVYRNVPESEHRVLYAYGRS